MARRPDPPDDDDAPPPRKKVTRSEDRSEAAASSNGDAALQESEEAPAGPKPLTELSDKALVRKLARYSEEFQLLSGDPSQAAVIRRVELTRLMRAVQDVRMAREPIIEITVPRSVTGEPFTLGPVKYWPGVHRVPASTASYLLWMISENQRVELNRLKSNGRTIDLGVVGQRARLARIARDDGADDYGGRGNE